MPVLQDIVRVLARPIEFATSNDSAKLSSVQNLGPFVTQQILKALAQEIFLPSIEADLLALRQLFSDYHNGLSLTERKRRLSDAGEILARLREYQTGKKTVSATPAVAKVSSSGKASHRKRSQDRFKSHDLWNIPIQYARGVGPKRAVLLDRLGVRTVEDAFWMLPWRYEDRSVVTPIRNLVPGRKATLCGTIAKVTLKRTSRRSFTILEVLVQDTTGSLACLYFNQPYLEGVLPIGSSVMMHGMVSAGRKRGGACQMDSPHFEVLGEASESLLHVGRIVPIYHETKGLTSRQLRTIVHGVLDMYLPLVEEILPSSILDRHALPPLRRALTDVHFPPAQAELSSLERAETAAHRRMTFEELLLLELALGIRQQTVKEEKKGVTFRLNTPLLKKLTTLLPFQLTSAQVRVWSEIKNDMGSRSPMNRLVQGDVGCGKTVVALHALVLSCGSGYQSAFLVPTEILAEQHYLNLRSILERLGLSVRLLTSGSRGKDRAGLVQQVEEGQVDILVGTHALLQKDVRFRRLGLVVIDEQHKFGVLQRKALLDKGYHPDVLVLTATPIPRTLAMTVYGDLDISVIDELPPGRKPVETKVFTESQRKTVYRLMKKKIQCGRQAYIVYPLVEESEKSDLQAVLQSAEQLQAGEFQEFRLGVLHGRMKTEEKEAVMAGFKSHQVDILVATTVIEVGVDVPNASVMLVEHANRFGLAQLHQLRGRVGRGANQSYCFLMTAGRPIMRQQDSKDGELSFWKTSRPSLGAQTPSRKRLEALVNSNDGFFIAEEDLNIRGPGEFFGVRQWGIPEFRAANIVRDIRVLEQARGEAWKLLEEDPQLKLLQHQKLRRATLRRWKSKLDLGSVS